MTAINPKKEIYPVEDKGIMRVIQGANSRLQEEMDSCLRRHRLMSLGEKRTV
jgi:hypothetical protein